MSQTPDFDFGDDAVATAYDRVIVPTLFYPWTSKLIEDHGPWEGRRVLDLATGTGVVAQFLAERVGADGAVTGADINGQMLQMARRRCAEVEGAVEFVETPAHPLDIADESMDSVVCQQGFQFFPDRDAAAVEVHRVLRDGGKAVFTTWEPVTECRGFGVICDALEAIGEPDISASMRVPFDNMPAGELVSHFESAGFGNIEIEQHRIDLVVDGGPEKAVELAYATPIGPALLGLPEARQDEFRKALAGLVPGNGNGATNMGGMVSNVLVAEKAR